MTAAMPRTTWDKLNAAYLAARSYSDSLPDRHPDEDAAVDRYCAAMDLVVHAPAPDCEALATKIAYMRDREFYADDWLEIFEADARRLHGEGR